MNMIKFYLQEFLILSNVKSGRLKTLSYENLHQKLHNDYHIIHLYKSEYNHGTYV